MEVNAVAIVVIQKLTDMLTDEKSIIGQKDIVVLQLLLNEIKKDLEGLSDFFIDAESAAVYLKILYDVEDAIETFALRISLQRKRLGFLMNHALFLKNFTAYKKLKRKFGKIKENIMNLKDKKCNEPRVQNGSLRSSTPRSDDIDQKSSTNGDNETDLVTENIKNVQTNRRLYSKFSKSHAHKPDELGLVGLDTLIDELVPELTKEDELISELTKEAHQIIQLVGEKGSGKTTLARVILATKKVKDYFHPSRVILASKKVKDNFHPFAWVTIDEDSTPEDILLNLLKQVDKEQDYIHRIDPLIDRLKERLNEQRFLIVLDNLQESDTWGKIKNAFLELDNSNGTKIIITTRADGGVTVSANRSYSLNMERLTDKDALSLFQRKAGKAGSECPEYLKQKILKMCDGLPLNVVLLGSLLSMEDPTSLEKKIDRGDWQKSSILGLSYDDICVEEKLCLLYMVLFPKEYDIPVRRLLRLWLAEGFIKRSEDNVNQCFDNLVRRSLILITNQRSDGGDRKCRLLGVMHEYLFSKAIDIKLFHVHKNNDCSKDAASTGARRLVEFVDRQKCSFSKEEKNLTSWRSYLSFNFQKKDTPAREVGVLLSDMLKSGFSLLRVLDLEGVYKPNLPDNLGNFFQLRYLGLRWTFLDHLPSSVGDLTYLETLDLKHTNVNKLPSSVWKLNHLRHLNLNDIRLDLPVTSNDSFPGLLTLCGLSIDEECLVKDGLDRLRSLRELDLTFQLNNCGELLDWVSGLTYLEQLRLRSKDDVGRAATLSLKPLSKLEKLSHMNLLGKLPKLLAHDEFPPNLKVLTISVSELQSDPMQTLGQLEHLTVLRLLANSYLGTKISCPPEGFKKLLVLKLWMLTNLEDWELGVNCMGKLNELNIRCCPNLKSIPAKLLRQDSFKELILNNMPPEFTKTAEDEKELHVSVIVKNYEFTPLP